MSAVLQHAWTALGAFLRGFTGVTRVPRCDHDHSDHDPRSIREALTEQASRRGRCC